MPCLRFQADDALGIYFSGDFQMKIVRLYFIGLDGHFVEKLFLKQLFIRSKFCSQVFMRKS